jgi:hypothetical protein
MVPLSAVTRPIRVGIAGLVFAAWISIAPATSASCVVFGTDAEMLAAAESVFVGRVVATTNQDRWASVGVEELWHGPDLPVVVEVRGGEEPGAASSVDRQYQSGSRYLFAVDVRDGELHDNACSMTQSWEDGLLRLRPVDARPPAAAETQDEANPVPGPGAELPLVALSGLLVALLGIVVFGSVRLARRGPGSH